VDQEKQKKKKRVTSRTNTHQRGKLPKGKNYVGGRSCVKILLCKDRDRENWDTEIFSVTGDGDRGGRAVYSDYGKKPASPVRKVGKKEKTNGKKSTAAHKRERVDSF